MSNILLQCLGQCNCERVRDNKRIPLAETAFQSLSPEEQDRVYRDLYGMEEPIAETPEFIREKLVELDKGLNCLNDHTTKYYKRALEMEQAQIHAVATTAYITSTQFKLLFLRADRYNTVNAAKRLARYFQEKCELFGEEKLACRITQQDCTTSHEDRKALISGGISYTGATDRGGRAIVMFRREQLLKECSASLRRVNFYIFHNILEEHPASQTKGVVMIGYDLHAPALSQPSDVRRIFPMIRTMLYALPFRFAGIHILFSDIRERVVGNLALVLCPKDVRARYHGHYQKTHLEGMLNLMQFGIIPVTLPLSTEGQFQHEMLWKYLQKRRTYEEEQQQQQLQQQQQEEEKERATYEEEQEDEEEEKQRAT